MRWSKGDFGFDPLLEFGILPIRVVTCINGSEECPERGRCTPHAGRDQELSYPLS